MEKKSLRKVQKKSFLEQDKEKGREENRKEKKISSNL